MTSEGEKILIVDDDVRLRRLLERFLTEQGYRVRAVENTEQMDRLLARELYSLIVLDLMLPGRDGIDVCRAIRAESGTPIVMLTGVPHMLRVLGELLDQGKRVLCSVETVVMAQRVKQWVLRRESARVYKASDVLALTAPWLRAHEV